MTEVRGITSFRVLLFLWALALCAGGGLAAEEVWDWPRLERERERLEVWERTLERQHRELGSGGTPGVSLSAGLQRRLAALSEADRERLRELRFGDDTQSESPALRELLSYLERGDRAVAGFQQAYDQYNEAKLDYLIQRYLHMAALILREGEKGGFSDSAGEKLQKSARRLAADAKAYFKAKGHLGRPQDRRRTMAASRFFRQFLEFVHEAGRSRRSWAQSARLKVEGLWSEFQRNFAFYAPFLIHFPETLRVLRNTADLFPSLDPIFQTEMALLGKRMRMVGREHLIPSRGDGVLNVYAIMHTHLTFDKAAVAALRLPKMAVLIAGNEPSARSFVDSRKELIPVRESAVNPLKKIVPLVRAGEIEHLVVFPEAAMPTYGFETRPGQRNFPLLIELLQREGISVRIIPIGLPRHMQFAENVLGGNTPLDVSELPVVVHPPLSPELVSLLVRVTEDRQGLNRLYRQQWIDTMARAGGGERLLGMPRIRTLVAAWEERFASRSGCAEWYRSLLASPGGAAPLPRASGG